MVLKKIGFYLSKGKCLAVYEKIKKSKTGKITKKKVNYKGKTLKKETKIFKTKTSCLNYLNKKHKNKFGESTCYYSMPYFGTMVPSVGKTWSGTPNTGITSSLWKWPAPPSAKAIDMQQGKWVKY